MTHKKANERDLPFYLKRALRNQQKLPQVKSFESNTSVEKEESDDDNVSTAYPSKMSSYSNMGININ